MYSLIVLTIFFIIIITLLSFTVKQIKTKIFFPFGFFLLSMILLIISPIIGHWGGMGLGAVSISLLLASVISLMTIVFMFQAAKTEKG